MTAKHCLASEPTRARFGSHLLRSGGQVVDIVDAVPGPGSSDIALLRLSRPVSGTPITIASSSPKPGTKVTLLGFGQTSQDELLSIPTASLQELQTTVRKNKACAPAIEDKELCLKSTPTRTSCFGDSGGPALVKGVLVGTTARGGRTCGAVDTIFTDTALLKPWIEKTINGKTSG